MNKLKSIIEVMAGIFFAVVAVITLAAALSRMTLSLGLPDANEIARMAQGIAILWGIAIACYDGRHVTVDLVYEQLSHRWRNIMDIFATLSIAIFLSVASVMTLIRAFEALKSGLTTNELRILVGPFWLLAGAGLCAAALLSLFRLVNIYREREK